MSVSGLLSPAGLDALLNYKKKQEKRSGREGGVVRCLQGGGWGKGHINIYSTSYILYQVYIVQTELHTYLYRCLLVLTLRYTVHRQGAKLVLLSAVSTIASPPVVKKKNGH